MGKMTNLLASEPGDPPAPDSWKEVANYVDQLYLQNDAANRALEGLGWPPPRLLDSELWPKLLAPLGARTLEDAREEVERAICDHYGQEHLDALLMEWRRRGCTKARRAILGEIIEGHLQGYFSLTVPTMFAQLEGIVADQLAPSQSMSEKRWTRLIEVLTKSPADWPGDRTAKKFFLNCMLHGFRRPSSIPTGPSRHAVLHGADITYATQENSLKVILAFEYVSRLLNSVQVWQEGVWHYPGCLVLDPLSDGFKLRRSLFRKMFVQSRAEVCSACVKESQVELIALDSDEARLLQLKNLS